MVIHTGKSSLIATFPAAARQGIFQSSPRRALSGRPYGGSCNKDTSQWIETLHGRIAQLVVGAAV